MWTFKNIMFLKSTFGLGNTKSIDRSLPTAPDPYLCFFSVPLPHQPALPSPLLQILQSCTHPVHLPPAAVLKVMLEQRLCVGGRFCINHMHTHLQKCVHVAHIDRLDDTHTHTQSGKSMQINPQAEPCYSINVSAPVISALVRSVRDDSETTSPFNWCHAPLLPPATD